MALCRVRIAASQTRVILEDQRLELAQQDGTLPGGEAQGSEGQRDSFSVHCSNGQQAAGIGVVGIASPQIGMILACQRLAVQHDPGVDHVSQAEGYKNRSSIGAPFSQPEWILAVHVLANQYDPDAEQTW